MHAEFARAVVDERHVLLDPPGDALRIADLVLERFEQGALTYESP
jgi:hypothetical protein